MNSTPTLSFPTRVEHLGRSSLDQPTVAVAVPVKDEAARIVACLTALASQTDVEMDTVCVVLLLNNCRDTTADQVRALSPELPFALHLHAVELPPPYANAGWARRLGMEAAAELVRPDGLILTTDADTVVDCDWIAANQAEIHKGVDAVAGYVMADPVELMELPANVLERGSLEWEYQQLAAELVARVDPDPCDPWPRHNQNCGASAAITAAAYRRIGGLPPRPVGEDRALFESLRRMDCNIRHSLDVQVVTSARTDGRALGGLSDAIRLRGEPDHPCDEMLEVAIVTLRRALWRSELRSLWAGRRDAIVRLDWPQKLQMSERDLARRTSAPPRAYGTISARSSRRSCSRRWTSPVRSSARRSRAWILRTIESS